MTGSFQRMIDLAGVLAKARTALEWLHILETPKKRHRLRIAILVCGFIGAAAVVLTPLYRGHRRSTVATVAGHEPVAAPAQEETDKEPEPTAAVLGR